MTSDLPLPMSVAIVSFNTRELLADCLTSLCATGPVPIVVVDNASTDGTVEMIREHFPSVELIVNTDNVGYGAGANQALSRWSTPAGLLLNPDTVVAPDAIACLSRYLDRHPEVGIVGPRLVGRDGRLQRSAFPWPGPWDTLMTDYGLHRVLRRIPGVRERALRASSHTRCRVVPWVLGAALAVRREAFDAAGGFDPEYFMYGEELDLCRRMAICGHATHFAPVTTVLHVGGASTRLRSDTMRREFVISHARNLRAIRAPWAVRTALSLLRAAMVARCVREVLRAGIASSAEARARHRDRARALSALIGERALWTP